LSEIHLNQLPYYDGSQSKLCLYIARVKFLLQLYPSQDVHQIHIIFAAIERTIVDSAQAVIVVVKSNTWGTTKEVLIAF